MRVRGLVRFRGGCCEKGMSCEVERLPSLVVRVGRHVHPTLATAEGFHERSAERFGGCVLMVSRSQLSSLQSLLVGSRKASTCLET